MNFKFLILAIFLSGYTFAKDGLDGMKLLLKYEDEQHYEVNFSEKNVHWKAVKGKEVGRTEVNSYKSMETSQDSYFVSWLEKDETFVVLSLNLKNMKVTTSGKVESVTWFKQGVIEKLANKHDNFWCKYSCNASGETTLRYGFSIRASCRISYSHCYKSCFSEEGKYAGCKYFSNGTL